MDKTPLDVEADEIRRRTRRSLLAAGAAAAISGGLWKWLNNWSQIDSLNAPFRKALDFNAAVARGLFREEVRAPEYAWSKAVRSFRFGNPGFNFAMPLQAIRLTRRADAFTTDYTPFALIKQLLERDGEFNEWQDEMSMSFGGFGLNYAAVGPVRESALDYLDFALEGDGRSAMLAVAILGGLLHNYLNRMGRASTDQEKEWQSNERMRCLETLRQRYDRPASPQLRAIIYDALRSATAINCPEPVREGAKKPLPTSLWTMKWPSSTRSVPPTTSFQCSPPSSTRSAGNSQLQL
ncbi:hypothetical protein [Tunturiibacter gelidiferens]|uniref:hypothetical protein n=1 Tax=Tunturiibacter gelidiferens TaxID=3069689 RepID=UPI003D9AE3C7